MAVLSSGSFRARLRRPAGGVKPPVMRMPGSQRQREAHRIDASGRQQAFEIANLALAEEPRDGSAREKTATSRSSECGDW
jgi:hypothetical protein